MLTDEDKAFFRMISATPERKYLGFKIQELVVLGSIFVALVTFHVQTKDVITRLVASTDWLMKYSKNSDGYHSAILGTQFEQGKPVNPNYEVLYGRKAEANK